MTGDNNFSSPSDGWAGAETQARCGQNVTVASDNDIAICNGQLVETTNDGGNVSTLAMYPKQPFDFASRTGTITFDVSDNSQGNHAAWPEFWITDKPVPVPFTHESSFISLPKNGFGIRFAGCDNISCNGGSPVYVGVDSAVIVRNYVGDDSFGGNLSIQGFDSMKEPTAPGQVNHVEVRVSQNQIDVYGTDAFSGPLNLAVTPLKHLATIPNANLSFTRGLIWIEDAHYNGNKFNTQATNTFVWDNVGFDGPVLPRDLAFDVNDSLTPDGSTANGDPRIDLGWFVPPGSSHTFNINNVSGLTNSTTAGALLEFSFYNQSSPLTLNYSINGHSHSQPWVYPDTAAYTPRTIAIPLTLSELQPGTNTITIGSEQGISVENIDIIVVGGGGIVNPELGGPTSTPAPTQGGGQPRFNRGQLLPLRQVRPRLVHRHLQTHLRLSLRQLLFLRQ